MAGTYREVERKYDVDADFVLPSVADLLPVADGETPYDAGPSATVELDATYFDTADHRLLHAGLSLRRRTGGADAGWHLKVPAADGERDEVRAALGRSERTVPVRLRRLVWIHTREAALLPVLRLQTTRRLALVRQNGSVLAEIADDRVLATRLPAADGSDAPGPQAWRELEVELVEGPPTLLKQVDKGLRKHGAARSKSRSKLARGLGQDRPARALGRAAARANVTRHPASSSAGDVVVAYLAAEMDRLADHDLAVRLDRPDSIHQMRVATRRLRTALQTFGPLFANGVTAPIQVELKWLADELGAARDAEVLRAKVADDIAREREGHHATAAVARHIDRDLAQVQRSTFAEVVAALDSQRYQLLVTALDEMVATPQLTDRAARRARKELRRPVAKAARRVDRALADARRLDPGPERDAALHEVRKKAKRARYAGEALVPAFGRRAQAFSAAMERLQDLLGEHHDGVVLMARLELLSAEAEPAAAFTLGRLHAARHMRQGDVEDEIAAVAKAATKKSLRAWLG